jgi:hypothetical protein
MYTSLRSLDRDADLLRLPDLGLLPADNPVTLPVAPVEVPVLVQRFPVVWRKDGDTYDLVALTGLTRSHDYWLPRPGSRDMLPLALRAFPLIVEDLNDAAHFPVLVDAATLLPDEDADIARKTAEFEQRVTALTAFAQSRRQLAPVTEDLIEFAALVPWEVDFADATQRITVEGLHYVDYSFLGSRWHRKMVERHGWLAASLLTLHRISLHRVGTMLGDIRQQRAREGGGAAG